MNDKITKAKEVAKARWHDDPRGTAFLLASVAKNKSHLYQLWGECTYWRRNVLEDSGALRKLEARK